MQCILCKIYFWKGFSYVLQINMHLICAPMLTKFYSCKKWVLHHTGSHYTRLILKHGTVYTTGQTPTYYDWLLLCYLCIYIPYKWTVCKCTNNIREANE
jgi:hypothetical protein